MNIKEERKAFDEQFGIDDANTFPAFGDGINSSAALKCNWLGWKARAEQEYKNNPEKIEIEGLKTIHKLCKFGAEHNMEGCSFTEIVERMFSELQDAKSQAVPEGFVLVLKEPKSEVLKAMSAEIIKPNNGRIFLANVYKAMIEAQEQSNG